MTDPLPASDTRRRIVATAIRLVEEKGARISMSQIARHAGVSRQTLYLQFGDRAGLFLELMLTRFETEPLAQVLLAAPDLPGEEAFDTYFRTWARLAVKLEPFIQPIWTAAMEDPELLAALRVADERLRKRQRQVFERLAEAGRLRSCWTVEEACESAWEMSLFLNFFGHAQNVRGWPPEQLEARAMAVLRAAFLAD